MISKPHSITTAPPYHRLLAVLYLVVAVGYVVLFVLRREAHLLDLPLWIYQGAVLHELLSGATGLPYAIKPYPVPNAFSTVFFLLTEPLLGGVVAGKLFVVLYLGASFALAYALAREVDGPTVARAFVIVSTLFISSSFWNGHLNFQVALLLGGVYLLLRLRVGRPPAWATLLFGLLLFFTHFIPYLIFVGGVGLEALRRRDRATLLALVPGLALSAWYTVGRLTHEVTEGIPETVFAPDGVVQAVLYKGYTVLKLGPFQHYVLLDGRGFLDAVPWLYWAFLALAILFVGSLGLGLLVGARQLVRDRSPRRWMALVGFVVAGLGLLVPAFALSVVNPSERVVAVAALVLLCTVPLPRRLLHALAGAAVLFCLYDLAFLATHPAPAPSEQEALYHGRAEAARAPRDHDAEAGAATFRRPHEYVTRSLYPGTDLKYLNHNPFFYTSHYVALERDDHTLRTFGTGILAER